MLRTIDRPTDFSMRARAGETLSLDDMRAKLPAIFAPEPHESRSSRYVYIPTHEIIESLVDNGFDPVEARVSRSRDEGKQAHAKHMVRFRSRDNVATRKIGDVSFELCLRNAHDGTAAYTFHAGLFRLVCLNGMVVNDGNIAEVHIRHSGNKHHQIAAVIDGANQVLEAAPIALEAPSKWGAIRLNTDEQMAFAEAARIVRFGDHEGNVTTPIQAGQLLEARRISDQGNDLWTTFNRVQENVIRGGIHAWGRDANNRPRRSTSREVKAIDGDIRMNKALWTLADALAKAKE